MDWDLTDALVAGALLAAAVVTVSYVARRTPTGPRRFAAVGVVVVLWALVWMELAVGIVGGPGHPVGFLIVVAVAAGTWWLAVRPAR